MCVRHAWTHHSQASANERQRGRMRAAQAESEGLRQMVRSVGLKRYRINYADVFLRQLINQEEGGKERGGQEQSAVSSLPPFHFHPALSLRPDRSRRPSSRPRPPPTSPLSRNQPDRSPRTLCAGADTQQEPPPPLIQRVLLTSHPLMIKTHSRTEHFAIWPPQCEIRKPPTRTE